MLALLKIWLAVIVVTDLRIRKVRNWMVVLGLAIGFLAIAVGRQPLQVSLWSGLAGMLVAFAALLPFYVLRWMGAGDVKFAAVVGLWFGLSPHLLTIWVGGSLLAGAHGILVLLWRRWQWSPVMNWVQAHLPLRMATDQARPTPSLVMQRGGSSQIQRSIPYAGYMALTAIWILLSR